MEVLLKCDDGIERTVWNFSNEYNDGRRLKNDLSSFGEYTVSVVFDEINENSRGDLLLYTFGGYNFDVTKADFLPSVKANVVTKAVLGESYAIPVARVTDVFKGVISDAVVTACVYDENGRLIPSDETFTPTSLQPYYIYYTYMQNGKTATAFYKVEVIESDSVELDYVFEQSLENELVVGTNTELYLPKASVQSALFASAYGENALVTLLKNGTPIDGLQNVNGGFVYRFDEIGEYEIRYSAPYLTGKWAKTESYKVIVDESKLSVILSESLDETYAIGSLVTIPQATMYIDGKTLMTTATAISPTGEEIVAESLLLEELGEYRIVYTSLDGNNRYEESFSAKNAYADQFHSSYAGDDAVHSELVANNETKGVKITLRENSTISYDSVIDLSDNTFDDGLTDRSRNKTLIEMYAQPQRINTPDVDALYITLTDKYDSDNYLEIRIKYLSYSNGGVYIRTRASGQANWVGYNYDFWTTELAVHNAMVHEEGGFYSYFSLSHEFSSPFEKMALRLYFDNETGCLYGEPAWKTGHTASGEDPNVIAPWLIRDYKTTDATLGSGNTPWKGFTTGEVYMSIYGKGIGNTADFYITELDGEKLDGQFVEPSKPQITVDKRGYTYVPYAIVDTPYPIFEHTAKDNGSAIVSDTVTVYRMSGDIIDRKRLVRITNNAFTPTVVGKYAVVYTATNAYGLETEEIVVVEAKKEIETLSLSVDWSNVSRDYVYGERMVLPAATARGGAGWTSISYAITNKGENVEIINGGCYFFEIGAYEITVTATDYIGLSVKESRTIDIDYADTVVFDEETIVLPPAFVVGETYNFDTYLARYYSENNASGEEVIARVEVTDGSGVRAIGSDGKYQPSNGSATQSATVKFSFEKVGAKTLEIVKHVPVLSIENGMGYIADLFVTENATKAVDLHNVSFRAADATQPMRFSFVRPVDSRNLIYKLSLPEGDSTFESFTVTLRDMYDAEAQIEMVFRRNGNELVCSVNGGTEIAVKTEDGALRIGYAENTHVLTDTLNMQIAKVEENKNGSSFNGFKSGAVYISTTVTGMHDGGSMGVQMINNQTINLIGFDIQTPNLSLLGSFEGRYELNQRVSLPMAVAYDVLSEIGAITVKVTKEDGTVCKAPETVRDGLYFTPTELGNYIVIYTVTDAVGNVETLKKHFSVYDAVKPTITFTGDLPKTVEVGSTIQLPNYVLADNYSINDLSVRIYMFTPDGMSQEAKNSVTFSVKGYYTINYLVVDKNNNINTYVFSIKAE